MNHTADAAAPALSDMARAAGQKVMAFLAVLGAALRAARAAESGRRPQAEDLRLLGVPPEALSRP